MACMTPDLDVCVRGGGIVGHTLALSLARERLRVGLVTSSASTPAFQGTDARAYALNAKSRSLLQSLRCWPDPGQATEVLTMQVKGDQGGEVNFCAVDLDVPGLMWIVDVPTLESNLAAAIGFQTRIEVLDRPRAAALTVVCEGKSSSTRSEFGVAFDVKPYHQSAVAARVQCAKAHAQCAYQWFSNGEILALLPLDGPQANSMAIVWSVPRQRADELLGVDAAEFCRLLEGVSGAPLGAMNLISERSAWPLQSAHASRWSGRHAGLPWVLVGDAAHNVHPLAGQGLNLGLADVAVLSATLGAREYWRQIGDERLLRRYERARKLQVLAMDRTVDGLQQLFASHAPGWQAARNWGMKGFDRSGLIKQWIARQAMGS